MVNYRRKHRQNQADEQTYRDHPQPAAKMATASRQGGNSGRDLNQWRGTLLAEAQAGPVLRPTPRAGLTGCD
jgi:hypothetical protein